MWPKKVQTSQAKETKEGQEEDREVLRWKPGTFSQDASLQDIRDMFQEHTMYLSHHKKIDIYANISLFLSYSEVTVTTRSSPYSAQIRVWYRFNFIDFDSDSAYRFRFFLIPSFDSM